MSRVHTLINNMDGVLDRFEEMSETATATPGQKLDALADMRFFLRGIANECGFTHQQLTRYGTFKASLRTAGLSDRQKEISVAEAIAAQKGLES